MTTETPAPVDAPAYSLDAMYVTSEALPDGATHYSATFPGHEPLSPTGFHSLLNQVAPGDTDRPGGIVADWMIVGSRDSLVQAHQVMGSAWDQFVKSQPTFMAVMKDAFSPNFSRAGAEYDIDRATSLGGVYANDELIPLQHVGMTNFIERAAKDWQHGPEAVVQLLMQSGIQRPHALVADAIRPFLSGPRAAAKPGKVIKELAILGESRRERVLKTVIRSAHAQLREQGMMSDYDPQALLTDDGPLRLIFETGTLPDGRRYAFRRGTLVKPLQAQMNDIRQMESTDGRFAAEGFVLRRISSQRSPNTPRYKTEILRNLSERHITYYLGNTMIRLAADHTIQPTISWLRHQDGSADFEFSGDETEPTTREAHTSKLLGVLTTAYLAPEVREDWPTEMRLKGLKRAQQLGPAQVPVLALFPHIKTQLLDSAVIRYAEAHAA